MPNVIKKCCCAFEWFYDLFQQTYFMGLFQWNKSGNEVRVLPTSSQLVRTLGSQIGSLFTDSQVRGSRFNFYPHPPNIPIWQRKDLPSARMTEKSNMLITLPIFNKNVSNVFLNMLILVARITSSGSYSICQLLYYQSYICTHPYKLFPWTSSGRPSKSNPNPKPTLNNEEVRSSQNAVAVCLVIQVHIK